ncbi:MAG: HAD family hydrolase [Thermodesulfobacteriota bacterium]
MISGIIFDLDGTLLDTLEDIADNLNEVLCRFGYPRRGLNEYRLLIGHGMRTLVKRALPGEAQYPGEVEDIISAYLDLYRRGWAVKTRPYDGIPEVLAQAEQSRLALAVLSNKRDEFTQKMVPHFFPERRFNLVLGVGASDRFPPKPDPAAALFISERLSLAPERFIYIGDSDVDMRTARSANMLAVGAAWGFRSREELVGAGAQAVLDHPRELMPFIRGVNSNG